MIGWARVDAPAKQSVARIDDVLVRHRADYRSAVAECDLPFVDIAD
ncbi:hypothetical protein AF72_03825 [Xylella taiwanensis]|uniref:Uncharacterized protein n=1 Tax=Xylella taiwanensis TaxID=1444770 RepID=Z9JKK5_9GAMM|nr:hypothetical protein AF72_03825 [Xylella taiwanensis]